MANEKAEKVLQDATLELTVLGGASLSYLLSTQELTQILGPGKPLAMLVYLAHLPSRTATRDHVLDLLWSNQVPSMAKPALRQAIWYIRQRIGNNGIESGDGMIKLAVPLESDADQFEAAVNDGDLERAVGLYGGAFLPDLAIPGGAEFEHWANAERARLESMFLRTSEVVIRSWLSQGQFQKAEKLARTVRDMNRVRQAGWRLLLEVLTSSGDAVRATVEAGELERTLAAEGIQPDRATTEAIRLARQMPATVSEPASGRTLIAELVGREREFATIIRAWGEAKTGLGRHLTITSGAGFGKTRLLTDVHMRLHASGVQLIHLRANVGERQIDYSLASNLAAALSQLPGAKGVPPVCASALVALNPSLSSLYEVPPASIKDSDVLRTRTIALCELLGAVAHEQPIAVLVDDLHWSDEASRKLLGGFAGCLADNPALMITASRPSARGPLQDTAQEEIMLAPLTSEHVLALVSSIGSLPDADWVRPALQSLREENGGSPLLVLESLQCALDRGSLRLREGSWSCNDSDTLISEFEQGGALRNRVAKLERPESWVLLILAVAGTPVSVHQLVRMTGRSEQSLFPVISTLEQHGFIARVENELEPAHDEIGALAVELGASDAVPAASGAVGRVLADEASDNDHLLLRAGQLLASATDRGRLNEVFRNRVWLARSRGDRRPTRELAREMLGKHYSAEESKSLFRSLPLYYRAGLTTTRRIASAVVAAFIAIASIHAAILWPEGEPPDAMFIAWDRGRRTDGYAIGAPLRRENWAVTDEVGLNRGVNAPRIDSLHGFPVPSPDGSMWAFSRMTSDSGELDIFVVDLAGIEHRLTHTPNDDGPMDWSPDGKELLFLTSRWHPREIYEAAILNLATLEVRRVTTSPHNEGSLRWSPDGTRIGYIRRMLGTQDMEFCWTTPDAKPPSCMARVTAFLGWIGPSHALMGIDSAGSRQLVSVNLPRHEHQKIITVGRGDRLIASRDGEWVAHFKRDSVAGAGGWSIFPTNEPDQAKQVRFPHDMLNADRVSFHVPTFENQYLHTLEIDPSKGPLITGIPFLLHAAGFDQQNRQLPLYTLLWSGDDDSDAIVDTSGLVTPRAAGDLFVQVSAGGWRADSLQLSVIEPWHEMVFTENWSNNSLGQWRLFGEPTPFITHGPDNVEGFWNKGDGAFSSGAYTMSEWNANQGIGVEFVSSTPITTPEQQKLALALVGWIDSTEVAGWDHRTEHMPGRGRPGEKRSCGVEYPDDLGVRTGEVRLHVGESVETIQTELPLTNGTWHTVRLQIFTDGTCGLAFNGRAIGRSTDRVPINGPYRLWTEGTSFESKMLVGPLEVWTGVRTDVDWAALDWPR